MVFVAFRSLAAGFAAGTCLVTTAFAQAVPPSANAGSQSPPTESATPLPPVVVTEPAQPQRLKAPIKKVATHNTGVKAAGPQKSPTNPASLTQSKSADADPSAIRSASFNDAQRAIYTQVGTNSYSFGAEAIQALPQGDQAPVGKVLLQAPGVTQDSAASGALHVRNEHANLQYRINGILLPDGVSGFADVLETGFIGNVSLVTGALPAEYGLRTSGLVDITTKEGAQQPGGAVSVYAGSRGTVTPSIEYGGTSGAVDYFFTGRYLTNDIGIESPTPSWDAIHDHTAQEKGFGYVSAMLDPSTRLSWISGVAVQNFQIPNTPGLTPNFSVAGAPGFDSALLNEHQFEQNYYDVIALQRKLESGDFQVAYFSRYSDLHFHPDELGDLVFNGIAWDVERRSFVNGIQADGSYRLNAFNTLRTGLVVTAEQTRAANTSLVLPAGAGPSPPPVPPLDPIFEETSKLGWLVGLYGQDEIKLSQQLTLNVGLRFDQMWQYVDANQFSPRVSLEYRPYEGATLHAGYARYFTPPPQVAAGPTAVSKFDGSSCSLELPV